MLPRFFAPGLERAGTSIVLDADESHHLSHVMRIAAGASVEVFNGRGLTRRGTVSIVAKRAVTIEPVQEAVEPRDGGVALTLAMAWLRADHMDAVVRDATMLGIRALQPLMTDRTTARIPRRDAPDIEARWTRLAIGSLKQCGGDWLPEWRPSMTLREWLEREPRDHIRLLLVEPDAESADVVRDVDAHALRAQAGATLVVGPEGGWTRDEVRLATAHGCLPWSLGPRVLRADAVPIAAVSALRYAWERRRPSNS